MTHFWNLAETAMDTAAPFVVIWVIYSVFLRPEPPNPSILMFWTAFLVFQFSRTNIRQSEESVRKLMRFIEDVR